MNKTNWNINGLIIEGICGAGKTSLFQGLIKHKAYLDKNFHSSLILSEHHTQRVLESIEKKNRLKKEDNLELLEKHLKYLESITEELIKMDWLKRNRSNHKFCYLFERYHLTHVSHYKHMEWHFVEKIDKRLSACNCKLCLLTISIDDMRQRIIEDRDSDWKLYISRYGKTDDEILNYYQNQQDSFIELCELSQIPFLQINSSKKTKNEIVEEVMEFWGI